MRVVLLGDTVNQPLTGIGRYTVALFQHLKARGVNISLWHGGHIVHELPSPSPTQAKSYRLRTVVLNYLKAFPRTVAIFHRLYVTLMGAIIRRQVQGALVHGSNYFVPKNLGASVVTLHDLSVYVWPQCHQQDRVLRMRHNIESAVQQASVVITHAEFNRQELLKHFDIPADSIVAIPLACDESFHPRSAHEIAETLSRYDVSFQSYGLFVGTIEPRKNVLTLLDAWAKMAHRQRYPLVLIGGKGWRSEDIHQQISIYEQQGWLRYVGYVPESDLPIIYAGAAVFCFPSHYEGFGLPVLEAMASGVAVISSPAASLPEVGGSAVLYAPSNDTEVWISQIERVLTDTPLRESLQVAALDRAKTFSWALTAEKTEAAYNMAHARYLKKQVRQ